MLATDPKKLRWLGIDLRPRWRRRVAVVITYVVFLLLIGVVVHQVEHGRLSEYRFLALMAMGALTEGWRSISVFRTNGVVKSFDDAGVQKYTIIGSLDEWARQNYGVSDFEDASEEQRSELLRKYMVPAKPLESYRLDERERAERDQISRWSLMKLGLLLTCMTASTSLGRNPPSPFDVGALFWSFAILVFTLPRARVLWVEPDPRDAGEFKVIESEA